MILDIIVNISVALNKKFPARIKQRIDADINAPLLYNIFPREIIIGYNINSIPTIRGTYRNISLEFVPKSTVSVEVKNNRYNGHNFLL